MKRNVVMRRKNRWVAGMLPRNFVEEREVIGEGNVRRSVLQAHLMWVYEYGSAFDLTALWSRLSPALTAGLASESDRDTWLPFGWLVELDRSIPAVIAPDVPASAVHADLGRYVARTHYERANDQLADDRDMHQFLTEAVAVHGSLHDFGAVDYASSGASEGRIIYRDAPSFSRVHCAGVIGYYEQVLQQRGAIRARVTETRCRCRGDRHCAFDLNWR